MVAKCLLHLEGGPAYSLLHVAEELPRQQQGWLLLVKAIKDFRFHQMAFDLLQLLPCSHPMMQMVMAASLQELQVGHHDRKVGMDDHLDPPFQLFSILLFCFETTPTRI